MSPTLIFHSEGENNLDAKGKYNGLGKLHLAVGASGGPRIITATVQVFLNFCVVGMTLPSAIANARVHDQLLYRSKPGTLYDHDNLIPEGIIDTPMRTKEALLSRGHSLYPHDYMGTVQAVAVDLENNILTASSDIRKGGQPYGY